MDYSKLDGALVAALRAAQDPEGSRLTVFVHTAGVPGPNETALLQSLGVEPAAGRSILTAELSPSAIDSLSAQSWVRSIRLARRVGLRGR